MVAVWMVFFYVMNGDRESCVDGMWAGWSHGAGLQRASHKLTTHPEWEWAEVRWVSNTEEVN